ncbi:MAG: YtxH domain-containing protein [Acidobacteria bacterium]|nr:YtxH domain-containing protein [Acidobacteriota bacterium]
MARSDSDAAATVVVAFVLGAVTGAAVALLMAPATGEETRRILSDRAREASDRANDVARQGREFINQQRDNLSSAIDRGREAYNQARSGGAPRSPTDVGDAL